MAFVFGLFEGFVNAAHIFVSLEAIRHTHRAGRPEPLSSRAARETALPNAVEGTLLTILTLVEAAGPGNRVKAAKRRRRVCHLSSGKSLTAFSKKGRRDGLLQNRCSTA
jgi:hypothetical protein